MAYVKSDELERFRALARTLYFSSETVDVFVANGTAGQMRAVAQMIEHELEVRARRKKERLMRKARLPFVKTFDGYDFAEVAMPDGYSPADLMSLSFVDRAQDFVFHGQTGRGKTHLAVAIAVACVESGREARFFTAADLVMALKRADRSSQLDSFLRDLARAEVLVIDELGYVPVDIEGARLLFQAMSDTYEKRTMVVTTNIEFSKWGTVFGDDKMASALIDRIVHHGRLVEFNGPSRRVDAALMLGKSGE